MNLKILMEDYLRESTQEKIQDNLFGKIDSSFPVQVQSKPEWQKVDNPERLVRKFSFKTENEVIQFLFEVIKYEKEVNHHGKLTVEGKFVTAEVYTHTLESITELDIEYAKELSGIYVDVKDYERK